MKKLTALALAAILLLGLAACGGAQQPAASASPSAAPKASAAPEASPAADADATSQEPKDLSALGPIVIGLYGPMSGNAAMVGITQEQGVRLAADHINAAGGIQGRMIEIVLEDDASDPATAVSAVNKLVYSHEVTAVIGTVSSSCTLSSMEVTQSAGIPHITAISSGASVTQQDNPWIARMQASDLLQAEYVLEYAVEKMGAKKIACIYSSDDYGADAYQTIARVYREGYGKELIAAETFEPNAMDMSAQLLNVREADPDVIIFWCLYQQGALLAKQARKLGIEAPFIGGSGLTNAGLYTLGGEDVIGLINSQAFFVDKSRTTPEAASFIEAYETMYGKLPDSNTAMSYDAMMVMAEGLRADPETLDPQKIMAGIKAVKDKPMATGIVTIAPNGDAVREELIMVRLVGDNQYEIADR